MNNIIFFLVNNIMIDLNSLRKISLLDLGSFLQCPVKMNGHLTRHCKNGP